MTRFLSQLFIFATLLIGGYFAIRAVTYKKTEFYHGFSPGYMSGIRLKHERANEFSGPRVFFVGGSSSAYGIDSQVIEEEILTPVVNLGLNAGLGLPFILNQTKMLMHEGDIIILSIEYLMGVGDYKLIEQTCRTFPEVAALQKNSIKQDIQFHLNETRQGFINWTEEYSRTDSADFIFNAWDLKYNAEKNGSSTFNKYGDVIYHLEAEERYHRPSDETKTHYHYWEGIELLNDFKSEAEKKGATVFFGFPPYARSNFDRHKESLKKIEIDLRNDLEIEIINTPEDLVFDDNYFYDTHYHLAKEGRKLRTVKLLASIQNNPNAMAAITEASKVYK